MTAQHLAADEPFYRQWSRRGTMPRTLTSSRRLLNLLGFTAPPSLAVVGSKGKGTAAAAATMALVDSGLTTVSVTSPAFRTNRERIRINGAALTLEAYELVSEKLAGLLPLLPADHYLSPTGAYTIMGAWYASHIGADVLVLEEGMGGSTDEVSFFDHTALAVTPIFLEHAGILGNTEGEIAENLLGAGSASVRLIASAPQSPEITSLVENRATEWGATLVPTSPAHHRNPLVGESMGLGRAMGSVFAKLLLSEPRHSCSEPSRPLTVPDSFPSQPSRNSLDETSGAAPPAESGARRTSFSSDTGVQASAADSGSSTRHSTSLPGDWVNLPVDSLDFPHDPVTAPDRSLNLPGRSSIHETASGTWFVDAAIAPAAVEAALRASAMSKPVVIASWPLSKDHEGCFEIVPDAILVRSGVGLAFPPGLPSLADVAPGLSGDVIALGTISFIAEVLDYLGASTESW